MKTKPCSKCNDEIPKKVIAYLHGRRVCQKCWNQRKEGRLGRPRRYTWLDKYFETLITYPTLKEND